MRILSNLRIIVLVLAGILLNFSVNAQGIRVTYSRYYKIDKELRGYKADMDLTLDYTPSHSSFYSDNTFVRDSIGLIAFNGQGGIKDDEAYAKMVRLPGTTSKDVVLYDAANGTVTEYYRLATHIIKGEENVGIPKWAISDETSEILEYKVRKAEAEFLGRRWIVWFAEEIPASAGPWMLTGTPGLILKAEDSESLFKFEARYIENLSEEDDRFTRLTEILEKQLKRPYGKSLKFSGSLKECEKINYKIHTDVDYFNRVSGIVTQDSSDGANILKYIPLIPAGFLK